MSDDGGDGVAREALGPNVAVDGTMTQPMQLFCYGEPFVESDDLAKAFVTVEHHIAICPKGPMPWAYAITWHGPRDGFYTSSANGEWLGHSVKVNEVQA